MATLKELFDKYDVDLELEEYILNHKVVDDINLINECFEETDGGQKIYVFRGKNDELESYSEYIVNPKDKNEGGAVTITFFGYPDNKYETAVSVHQYIFGKDGIVTEMTM